MCSRSGSAPSWRLCRRFRLARGRALRCAATPAPTGQRSHRSWSRTCQRGGTCAISSQGRAASTTSASASTCTSASASTATATATIAAAAHAASVGAAIDTAAAPAAAAPAAAASATLLHRLRHMPRPASRLVAQVPTDVGDTAWSKVLPFRQCPSSAPAPPQVRTRLAAALGSPALLR